MDVSEAVNSRKSIRAFLDKSVDDTLIQELLEKSSRAASGGNLQPWQIYVINGNTMNSFHQFQSEWTEPETPAKQVLKNYTFFGAPAAFFCFVDRQMGRPQWSDLGMFLQTFMLLAREAGLDTCPQEAWAMKQESVTAFVEAPDELMLFCGMAIGYQDESEKVNELRTSRRPIEDWTVFLKK